MLRNTRRRRRGPKAARLAAVDANQWVSGYMEAPHTVLFSL